MKLLMTSFVASIIALSSLSIAHAEYVSGHYRSNGTYVQGYYRTDRNNTNVDNYSYNPRTDTPKYYDSPSYSSPSYSSPSYSSPSYSSPSYSSPCPYTSHSCD